MTLDYNIIEEYRIEKNLTIVQLSNLINITPNVYNASILGRNNYGIFKRTNPRKSNRRKIERWLKQNEAEIFSTIQPSSNLSQNTLTPAESQYKGEK